jgi:hypothetical protein
MARVPYFRIFLTRLKISSSEAVLRILTNFCSDTDIGRNKINARSSNLVISVQKNLFCAKRKYTLNLMSIKSSPIQIQIRNTVLKVYFMVT